MDKHVKCAKCGEELEIKKVVIKYFDHEFRKDVPCCPKCGQPYICLLYTSCSQIVLGEFAEELGYSREEAYKMANAFGGGCFRGDTCGAVAGAMIAIGLKYGNDEPGNIEQDALCQQKVKEFQQKFTDRRKSLICRDLLGYDFADAKQREEAFATGKMCIRDRIKATTLRSISAWVSAEQAREVSPPRYWSVTVSNATMPKFSLIP